jgi:hypothetical protein
MSTIRSLPKSTAKRVDVLLRSQTSQQSAPPLFILQTPQLSLVAATHVKNSNMPDLLALVLRLNQLVFILLGIVPTASASFSPKLHSTQRLLRPGLQQVDTLPAAKSLPSTNVRPNTRMLVPDV